MAADHIRIFRPTWGPGVSATRKYAWYFLDQRRRRVNCRSGYEALFATHLVATGIQFEYESLALVVTGKAPYIPDFFLSTKGEFVELKGWTGDKSANKGAGRGGRVRQTSGGLFRRSDLNNFSWRDSR